MQIGSNDDQTLFCFKTDNSFDSFKCWNLLGSIHRAIARGDSEVFFLPQRPYLTNGTLRQQVCFIIHKL